MRGRTKRSRPDQERRHQLHHQYAQWQIPREHEVAIRNAALAAKIPIMTTVRAALASANGIRSLQKRKVRSAACRNTT